MANFELSIEKTLRWEGGYSCNPHDPGGETLFGIARNRHPEWDGWHRVDELKKHFTPDHLTGVLCADGGLLESAKQFYQEEFWDYDEIDSQPVADKVFDLGVNVGQGRAVRWLQQAVGAEPDGKFGPKTLLLTNTLSAEAVLDKLRSQAKQYYLSLNKPEFIRGWLRRLES